MIDEGIVAFEDIVEGTFALAWRNELHVRLVVTGAYRNVHVLRWVMDNFTDFITEALEELARARRLSRGKSEVMKAQSEILHPSAPNT
jgi:hypothetical protein